MEHLDVLIVGAGLSGIGAAHHLQTDCPWASYAIFEARDAIGGTWDLFRYPGIRSDSDMYTLGYPFRPWTGEKSIADGDSILQYIRDTATESGIDEQDPLPPPHRRRRLVDRRRPLDRHRRAHRHRRGGQRSPAASCSPAPATTATTTATSPTSPGMDRFAGTIVHPQALARRPRRRPAGGSSSSAAAPPRSRSSRRWPRRPRTSRCCSARRPTSPRCPSTNPAAQLLHRVLPARWAEPAIRWMLALGTQALFQAQPAVAGPGEADAAQGPRARACPTGYDIDTHFTPRYDPWDQRLCAVPDGDLFAAIRSGTASVVTDHIDTFTETGLRLESGAELEADIVVTATGLELLFLGDIARVGRRRRGRPARAG